jgi:hypothetical protein
MFIIGEPPKSHLATVPIASSVLIAALCAYLIQR